MSSIEGAGARPVLPTPGLEAVDASEKPSAEDAPIGQGAPSSMPGAGFGGSSILDDLQVTSAALRANTPQVSDAVQVGMQRLDRVLSEQNLARVDNILSNLESASADVGQMVQRMDTAATAINGVIADVDTLIDSSSPQLAAALADVRGTLLSVSETVDTIGHHLEGSSRNMHEFSRRIRDNPSALLLSTAPQEVSRP